MALDFVAIDFETANSFRASACAVGMVRIVDGQIQDEETFLIKPPAEIGHFGTIQMGIHKIKPTDVLDAPGWIEASQRIKKFIGHDYVVAHNAAFDFSVISSSQQFHGLPHFDLSHYCTVQLCRAALPGLRDHKLKTVVKALSLGSFRHHTASDDARMAALLCVKLAEEWGFDCLPSLMDGYDVKAKHLGRGRRTSARKACACGI